MKKNGVRGFILCHLARRCYISKVTLSKKVIK
jgi:hypothetical protein